MREKDADSYLKFGRKFGRAIKEGVSSDYENKERLWSCWSSSPPTTRRSSRRSKTTSPDEGGPDGDLYLPASRASSGEFAAPEASGTRGSRSSTWWTRWMSALTQSLTSTAASAEVRWARARSRGQRGGGGSKPRRSSRPRRRSSSRCGSAPEEARRARQQVRLTNRITNLAGLPGRRRARLQPAAREALQKGKGGGPKQRRILELNPRHELLDKLRARFEQSQDDPVLDQYAQLLFGYGVLAEGSEMPEPAKFNKAVAELMTRGL